MVSVIIPTYNCGAFVREAVESVLGQSHRDLEVVVVDDGSTDDTPVVLARIEDPRVTVIRSPHRGLSAARNEGLDRARGEYIAFLDADDRWLPSKLDRQVALMDAEPEVCLTFTNLTRFNAEREFPDDQFTFFPELDGVATVESLGGRVVEDDAFATFIRWGEFPTWMQTTMVRASMVGDLRFEDCQDEQGRVVIPEDGLYCFQAFLRGPVGYVEDTVVQVRRHLGNVSKLPGDLTARELANAEGKLVMLRRLAHEDLTFVQRSRLRKRTRRQLLVVGALHLQHGRRAIALAHYGRALWAPLRSADSASR